MDNKVQDLFQDELTVINIGLRKFAEELEDQKINVVQVDWSPPAGGDQDLIDLLDDLL
ncbi:MAG: hypothetical protein HQ574_04700 [Chloroflexi bacterium]|nr:hypothetical protein [Chloroflexota bacterium]